jgi:hypothetical protein
MGELDTALRVNHRFTPAYTPRANGTVEAVCKQFLRATKAVCADFGLQPDEWPKVLPVIQSVLNNLPTSRNAGFSPMSLSWT